MSLSRKKHPVTKEVMEVTQVLATCLALKTEERPKFLLDIRKKSPGVYEEVEALLNTADKAFVPDEKFLSALVTKAKKIVSGKQEISQKLFEPFELGKYVFLQELGRGGMAVVYRGKTRGAGGFQKTVAIKKVLAEHMENQDIKDLFEFEAHLSALLQHPNIVHVFDYFHREGSFYLAMEFVHGKNLSQLLKCLSDAGMVLPLECCLHIVCEVLKGLEYAHHKTDEKTGEPLNIVHRDISPRNVMISYNGDTKIVDFGIAKTQDRLEITQTGSFRGTVSYMAPEVLNGGKADAKADLFAAAVLLYELMSGKVLFKSDSIVTAIDLVRSCNVKPQLDDLKVDDALKSILRRGLEREPELRFHSAEEFSNELQHYLYSRFRTGVSKKLSFILKSMFKEELEQEADVLEAAERKLEEERKKRTRTGGIGSKLAGFRWDAFAFGAFVFLAGGALMAKMLWKKEEPIAVSVPVVQLAPPIAHEPKLVTPPVLAKKEVPPPVQVPEAPVQPKSKPAAPAVVAVLKRENASVNGCSVLFNSKPAKASLVVNGENKGLTPLVAQVACGSNQKISVELDGYEKLEKTVVVRKSGSKMTLVLKKHE